MKPQRRSGISSAPQSNKEEIMGTWFIFMLKSMLCLTTLFLFYKVLLSKETFHTLNRYVLMGILAVSVLLPFCEIPTTEVRPIQVAFHTLEVVVTADSPIKEKTENEALTPTATVDNEKSLKETEYERVYPEEKASASGLNLHLFLIVFLVIYLLGAAVRMSVVARSLYLLYKTIGRAKKVKHGKYTIAILPGKVSPYSWWKYIVLSEEDYKGKNDEILAHELAHLNRHHSTDVMLCELFTIFQWFNPATYLLKQELQSIHEYEADSAVITNGFNPTRYQLLLIKEAVGSSSYTLANSLNHSSLKKRITMMLRKRSNRWAQMKAFGFLPLAAILLSAFARPEVSAKTEALTTDKSTENVLIKDAGLLKEKDSTKVVDKTSFEYYSNLLNKDLKSLPFSSLDKVPEYPGGDKALMNFLYSQVFFGTGDTNDGLIIVSFDINKDGSVANAKLERCTYKKVGASALQLVNSMPKWSPAIKNGKPVAVKRYFSFLTDGTVEGITPPLPPEQEMPKKLTYSKPAVPYAIMENPPVFPGGEAKLMEFVQKIVQYPKEARTRGEKGRVTVSFIIGSNGKVYNAKIERGVSPDLDAEALRVVNAMSDWTPGTLRGKPVNVKYVLPVTFRLTK
ncbi:MAG: M56 family metallopeptidase [Bacteroidales bacterium]|nr:M56 family metallopeptidase [Bacteroidales bacterium]